MNRSTRPAAADVLGLLAFTRPEAQDVSVRDLHNRVRAVIADHIGTPSGSGIG